MPYDMKKYTYRLSLLKISIAVIVAIIFTSCENEEKEIRPNPSINIVINPEYVYTDTTILVGQMIKIGIQAEYNGYDRLTNFIAKLNGERYLDLGFYAESYTKEINITKGLDEIEEWEFIIRDIDGNFASTYLTIHKDKLIIYGEVEKFLNIKLGAQNNTEFGSFFSLSNGIVYDLEGAYTNSELIDLVYYYDNFDKLEKNIIASPGANIGETAFPGQFAISNWETINTTRYSREKLDITIEEFDNAANDSILIANTFAFESGGRKTKFLEGGDIYSFVRGGQTGMFKVVSILGTTTGNIIVDIKVQKLN